MQIYKLLLQTVRVSLDIGVALRLVGLLGVFPSISSLPIPRNGVDPIDRMFLPPNFPYDAPYGYRASGLLCIFSDLPYLGGWAGRSCAGAVPPFAIPTPPTTTTTSTTTSTTEMPTADDAAQQMVASGSSLSFSSSYSPYMNMGLSNPLNLNPFYHHHSAVHNPNQYADYGDPVEGNPWEPDDDDIFIENYGFPASRPGFRLGPPRAY